MLQPIHIEPDAVYDDGAVVQALGITFVALTRARRDGRLRHTRQGRRILYRGSWLLAWLDADADRTTGGPTRAS